MNSAFRGVIVHYSPYSTPSFEKNSFYKSFFWFWLPMGPANATMTWPSGARRGQKVRELNCGKPTRWREEAATNRATLLAKASPDGKRGPLVFSFFYSPPQPNNLRRGTEKERKKSLCPFFFCFAEYGYGFRAMFRGSRATPLPLAILPTSTQLRSAARTQSRHQALDPHRMM